MMQLHSPAATRGRSTWPRSAWLAVLVIAALAALAWHGPIAQWDSFHHFADVHAWAGIPNAANVLTNLPFLVVGAWGLWRLRGMSSRAPSKDAWCLFAIAVAATAFGSAWYHWAPANGPLVFDRLPIAWACATLTCALLAERVAPAWGSRGALAAALAIATASVVAWWWSEQAGVGDLRPYVAVQFLPMLLVPAIFALRLPPTAPGAVAGRDWFVVLALYALAKALEVADGPIHEALGVVGGHPVKHLVAAAAAGWLLFSCGSRR